MCNPSKKLLRELRERIVTRAHHHDAITAAGQADLPSERLARAPQAAKPLPRRRGVK
jgi:hypothetical protein